MGAERTSLVSTPEGDLGVFPNTARWVKAITIYRRKRFGFLLRTDNGALWIGAGVPVTLSHDVIDPALPPMLNADDTLSVEAWAHDEPPTGYPVVIELDDTTVDLTNE